jgi:hypothetical protein
MRRACSACHVPVDGLGAITTADVSHGLCDTCGSEHYADLWIDRVGIGRWPGSRLAQARSLAHHSTRRLAGWLGVAHSTVQRQERRERLTPYMQRRITAAPRVHALYRGLTENHA